MSAAGAMVLEIPRPSRVDRLSEAESKRNPRGVYEKVRGSGEWWVRYADATGRIRRERAPSKSGAIALYRKRKTEALQGKKLPETLRAAAVSFKQIAEYAMADIQHRYSRPADDVARLRTAVEWFGSREAASLTPGEIDAKLIAVAAQEEWADSTINHYRSVLSLAYRLAKRDLKVTTNPVRDVPHRTENNDRVRCLTPDEETRLRKAIRSNPAWREREPELDFALHSGLRRSSMYEHLVWENVDLRARTATIPRTKNGEMVVIPLNNDALRAMRIFRSRGDGTGQVVRNAQGQALKWPKIWFAPAVREAEIRDFHWHDLRHCFATRLRERGISLEDISDLLAHKGLAMTRRYAHTDLPRLHQAVRLLARKRTDTTTSTAPSKRNRARVAGAR